MTRLIQSIRNAKRLQRTLAGGLIAAFLIVLAMEACPAFHEFIHNDAGADDHECAVTLFQSGACHSAPVLAFVVGDISPLCFFEVPAVAGQWVPGIFLTRNILEHAPPACV
jgi:hypothetical protein